MRRPAVGKRLRFATGGASSITYNYNMPIRVSFKIVRLSMLRIVRLRGWTVLEQLRLEEALFRVDAGNW